VERELIVGVVVGESVGIGVDVGLIVGESGVGESLVGHQSM